MLRPSPFTRLARQLRYNAALLKMRLRRSNHPTERAEWRIEEMQRVVHDFEAATGRKAAESCIVEVGFGARPERALAMSCFFGRVYAIDLALPVLGLGDIPRVFWRSGARRGVKSSVRHLFFDRTWWPAFHARLRALAPSYRPDKTKFIIGSAGDWDSWNTIPEVHAVFSHDVLEHIPVAELRSLLEIMRQRLSPDGVAMLSPCVFTGIIGGHDPNWYQYRVPTNESETAWAHLYDPEFVPVTYLNRLSRRAFRSMFEDAGFVTERDEAIWGDDFGRQHLTPANRAKLSGWDDYELFSNIVDFRLRPAAS
jgi:hypothetical protein